MSIGFASGTRIRTTRGDIAVEDLQVGDEAVTASGATRPIAWIDSQTIANPGRDDAPIRIGPNAFTDGGPAQDVMLWPGHCVVVKVMDEVFIPVGELVNGATIARETTDEVVYWRVGLDAPDVILADGLKVESALEAGDQEPDQGAPEPASKKPAGRARPLVDKGVVVGVARDRLITRAEGLGWTRRGDLDLQLRLAVDGARCEADFDGDLARFVFPSSATNVFIASRIFVPAWESGVRDYRDLGIAVTSLRIMDGLRFYRDIPLDHPALGEGFYGLERHDERIWRWTTGVGALPASLWEGCRGLVILRVGFDPTAGWSWAPPQAVEANSESDAPEGVAAKGAGPDSDAEPEGDGEAVDPHAQD
jgi:hypothetical protein